MEVLRICMSVCTLYSVQRLTWKSSVKLPYISYLFASLYEYKMVPFRVLDLARLYALIKLGSRRNHVKKNLRIIFTVYWSKNFFNNSLPEHRSWYPWSWGWRGPPYTLWRRTLGRHCLTKKESFLSSFYSLNCQQEGTESEFVNFKEPRNPFGKPM